MPASRIEVLITEGLHIDRVVIIVSFCLFVRWW